ncbi:unnamed protein product [Brassicogethes aeneus]|uniref:EF-hand domain-containing protein n=1 Tax=Brassicogethes aeneus TaxID=1431903 RepID=A0A9P0B191_BRAAE|nr:unnamed protein product [Brassicogethes aeneus]
MENKYTRRRSSIKKEFTQKELEDLKTAFQLLDRNQDGKVTSREFRIMLLNLGIEIKEDVVEEILRNISHAGKELIDESDFLNFVRQIQNLCPELNKDDHQDDLLAAFQVFDIDNDGYIKRDELKIAMEMIGEPVTEEQISNFIVMTGTDEEGKISYEGFLKLLT